MLSRLVFLFLFFSISKASEKEVFESKHSFFYNHFIAKKVVPIPIREFKNHLQTLISKSQNSYSPQLFHTMVPMGRSLQAPSTDFAHPRILFAFSPSPDSAGSRQDYQDLVDRIFVSYSELQNKLEIISWNNFEGRFNFEEVRNYIPGPGQEQEFIRETQVVANGFTVRQMCMTCHQSGGPIYADKPWSESSSSFGSHGGEKSPIVKKIEAALNSNLYLGLEVDLKDSNGKRPLIGGKIHAVVKSAHSSLLNARRVAGQGCGQSHRCQQAFLKSVIQLAKDGYYDDSENHFFMMIPFRDQLAPMIQIDRLPSHHFGYPSHTLLDFNPLAPPGPVSPEANPAFKRKVIEALLPQPGRDEQELVATQMLFRGYEGLGFLYANLSMIQNCDQVDLEKVFSSNAFDKIVRNWNVNDSDSQPKDFTSLSSSVLNLLEPVCQRENQ